ncbi:MAG: hypothetical protein ABI685_01610 [Ferruginibacter sp.]
MKKIVCIILISFFQKITFCQPIAFAPLPNSPMGKVLCFAYNSTANRIWACTQGKVFYSDNNGALWVNTAATGVGSIVAITLTVSGTPYILSSQNGMRHFNGTAWIADNNGLPTNPMPQFTSLAIDAAGNVYAGAGWHGLPPNYSSVWKWNGTAWATMNTGLPTVPVSPSPEITSMAIDASGNLFAGTAKVLLNGGGQGFGVYKWNGLSWNTFGTGLSNLNVASLAINSSGELFAGTYNSVSHISATSGGTWTNSTTGLPAFPTTVRSITFDALNNIYAGLGYLPEQAGSLYGSVYVSNNNGASWTKSIAFANTTTAVNAITADNAGNVFAAASGIYKSIDQGITWAIDTVGITKNKSRGGNIAINSTGHIFLAGEGDVFKSIDNGLTWQLIINGIDRHDLTCIAVDKSDNVYLGGQIWVGGSVRSDSGRVWKSTNGGLSWIKANVQDQQISEFKVAANGDVFMAHAFGTISDLAVTHDGTNWIALNIYSPGNPSGYGCFSVDVNKRGHIFCTTELAQVRRSVDGGATFASSTNLQAGNVQLVRVSPHDDIFINGPAPFGTSPLYYSDSLNNGTTFTQAVNFPVVGSGKSITDIAFDNRDSMYVGTQNGLYTTSLPFNPATSIFSLNASNGPASVVSFAKDKCGFLYTTTYFGGVSKSTAPVDNTTACNVLPLTLLSFEGLYNKDNNTIKLIWTTANEINNQHFTIEKSLDGRVFNLLDTVNATLANTYSQIDKSPYNGINFYRISATSNSGSIKYYNIISVRTNSNKSSGFTFDPNPVNDHANFHFFNPNGEKQLIIESEPGIKLIDMMIPGQVTTTLINLTALKPGVYFIKLVEKETGKIYTKKMIVQ